MKIEKYIYSWDGKEHEEVTSKIYDLAEVYFALSQCLKAPQSDTFIQFVIKDEGDIVFITGNEEITAYCETSGLSEYKLKGGNNDNN